MLPLLRIATDGKVHSFRNTVETIGNEIGLSEVDRQQMLPSRGAPLFYNRLAWAKTHLKMAGLLELPQRGTFRITDVGSELMAKKPPHIDLALLKTFPLYLLARNNDQPSQGNNASASGTQTVQGIESTPEETIEQAHHLLRRELADEVLASIMRCSPVFFERLIVQLMIQMGYGGSREEAGQAVGRSGDGGIDGIINEDRLGLDAIYLQAKRWEGVVGRPEIMRFVGALAGQRATKGVFITTSRFTQEAKDYASSSQYKIVLVDGERLADLMIEHDLGVSIAVTYHLKRIDSDFFSED